MDVLQLTRELVRINSVNPFDTVEHNGRTCGFGNETKINLFLEALLQENGFTVQRQVVQPPITVEQNGKLFQLPERYNLLAEKGTGKHSILLFGHTDTVDVKAGWQTDPFEATEQDVNDRPRLLGLGANDMKSGLAAIVAATSTTVPKDFKIKIAFLVDEEFWSFGAVELVKSDFLNDVALAVAPEISDPTSDPDCQYIGLGRLGRCEYEFHVGGVASHGSDVFIDPKMVNAVHESVKLERKVIDYCESLRRDFTADGISVRNSAYINFHQGGRAILSVPDAASFILDRSLMPGEDAESELEKLRMMAVGSLKDGTLDSRAQIRVGIRPRPTPPCNPFYFPSSLPMVKFIHGIVDRISPRSTLGIGRSVADENRIAERGICTIVLGPHGAGSHTPSEWVDVLSILRLKETLEAICESPSLSELLARAKTEEPTQAS